MKRRTTTIQQRINDMRIQKAIVGFQIPILAIPKLYRALEAAIAAGATNGELITLVAGFPGVEKV